jgi:copper oxidase (laccase) domain-containing protein
MSTRLGGDSAPPFDSLNLGNHVGDDPVHVQRNRQTLAHALSADTATAVRPVYLRQVHGRDVVALHAHTPDDTVADACFTQAPHLACTAMVADCLPVLLAHRSGRVVAAAHAGWRGLAGAGEMQGVGVLEHFFKHMPQLMHSDSSSKPTEKAAEEWQPHEWLVWLGPCIGATAFEVGAEVRAAFLSAAHTADQQAKVTACFHPITPSVHQYKADLAGLARLRLQALGVTELYGNDSSADWCTVRQHSLWFSHRRDSGRLGSSGRMVACIWRS